MLFSLEIDLATWQALGVFVSPLLLRMLMRYPPSNCDTTRLVQLWGEALKMVLNPIIFPSSVLRLTSPPQNPYADSVNILLSASDSQVALPDRYNRKLALDILCSAGEF
jgi:hypothetical protein